MFALQVPEASSEDISGKATLWASFRFCEMSAGRDEFSEGCEGSVRGVPSHDPDPSAGSCAQSECWYEGTTFFTDSSCRYWAIVRLYLAGDWTGSCCEGDPCSIRVLMRC